MKPEALLVPVANFLNVGKFFDRNNGSTGLREPKLYTLPNDFIREHHNATSTWQKVRLGSLQAEIEAFKNEKGFELKPQMLGILRPMKVRQAV